MNEQQRQQLIFERLQANNPNPTTELNYSTTFELLIAVALSAQATDTSVNKATRQLFKVANSPEAILNLGEQGLKHYIQTIGLYNSKARNIIKLCQQLVDYHNGEVPNTRQALEKLPGVGRKTANVILNTAFGEVTIAVDTHIFRVANRLQIAEGSTTREVEDQLTNNIPKNYQRDAHHWLILHGRYVCTAQKPKCAQCIVNDLCPSYPIQSKD